MANAASNPFSVGISTAPNFSMPTVQDERNTYTRWGWTWVEATANPAYNSAGTYTITNPDIHGDTEGDDVWAYLQAYNRRTTGRDGYLQRATAWRNYYVNLFEGSAAQANDESFLFDHFYGWGLQQYATQFSSDAGAATEALRICTTLHDWWAAGGATALASPGPSPALSTWLTTGTAARRATCTRRPQWPMRRATQRRSRFAIASSICGSSRRTGTT